MCYLCLSVQGMVFIVCMCMGTKMINETEQSPCEEEAKKRYLLFSWVIRMRIDMSKTHKIMNMVGKTFTGMLFTQSCSA